MKSSVRQKPDQKIDRTRPEQFAVRITDNLRSRVEAVAAALSNEAQTTTISDVARRCLVGHLPVLERELGLVENRPQSAETDTTQWVAEAKKRATKANAKV